MLSIVSTSKNLTNQHTEFEDFSADEIEEYFGQKKGSLLLYAEDDIDLYQNEPHYGREDQFPSFTNSVCSYTKKARKYVNEVLESKANPKFYVVCRIDEILSAQDHNKKWTRIARRLRQRKVVCLWVRECTKKNKLHYNFLISFPQSESDAEQAIRYAFEGTNFILYIKPCGTSFDDKRRLVNYIFKAKVSGVDSNNGEWTSDLYASKRVLFKKNSPLRKHSCIGQFYGDRKAVKERLKCKASEYADRRNEEQYLIDMATMEEQSQAKYLLEFGRYVGWKNADQILLSLVKTRMDKTTKASA